MIRRHQAGLSLAAIATVCLLTWSGTGAAYADYGFRSHYEICSKSGEFASIRSISVRENVFFADHIDDVIRVITQNGDHVTTSIGTGRPGEYFKDPIIGTSPDGSLYVMNNPTFDPRLFKFTPRGLEREITYAYGFPSTHSIFGTQPGGRGVALGEVFVGDGRTIKVFEANGELSEIYGIPRADLGFIGGITGVRGGVYAVASNGYAQEPSWVIALNAGSKPLSYIAPLRVLEKARFIHGAPDDSFWVLGGDSARFQGLEHYLPGQDAPAERIPISGSINTFAVAPNGSVWVARDDGLLRLGPNGTTVPPSQWRWRECGPPRVQTRVPGNQQVIRSRTLAVVAACNERCELRASGTLSVPAGARRTFELRPVRRRLAADRRVRLRLKLSRKAARAIRRAKRRGRVTRAYIMLRAADPGLTRSARQLSLTIG